MSALGGDDGDDVLQKATPLPYREANPFPLAPPFREKLMHGDPGAGTPKSSDPGYRGSTLSCRPRGWSST